MTADHTELLHQLDNLKKELAQETSLRKQVEQENASLKQELAEVKKRLQDFEVMNNFSAQLSMDADEFQRQQQLEKQKQKASIPDLIDFLETGKVEASSTTNGPTSDSVVDNNNNNNKRFSVEFSQFLTTNGSMTTATNSTTESTTPVSPSSKVDSPANNNQRMLASKPETHLDLDRTQ